MERAGWRSRRAAARLAEEGDSSAAVALLWPHADPAPTVLCALCCAVLCCAADLEAEQALADAAMAALLEEEET